MCMTSREAQQWLPVVRSFAGDLIDWRFGAAEGLARDCDKVEEPLLLFWDDAKMKQVTKKRNDQSDDADAQQWTAVEAIREVIANKLFFVSNVVFPE